MRGTTLLYNLYGIIPPHEFRTWIVLRSAIGFHDWIQKVNRSGFTMKSPAVGYTEFHGEGVISQTEDGTKD